MSPRQEGQFLGIDLLEEWISTKLFPSGQSRPADRDPPGTETVPALSDVQGQHGHPDGFKKIQLRYFGIGHTTGDTVVYCPDEKVAFVGDHVFVGRTPLIHAYKGGSALGNAANIEKMLAALPAEKFVCGHNDVQDRAGIMNSIAATKAMIGKVRGLKGKGLSVEDVRKAFAPGEAALAGIIYDEVK